MRVVVQCFQTLREVLLPGTGMGVFGMEDEPSDSKNRDLIEMTEVSQLAFGRRIAKGDSLLFLRALHLANGKAGTTQPAIRKELGLTQPAASRFVAMLKEQKWLSPSFRHRTAAKMRSEQRRRARNGWLSWRPSWSPSCASTPLRKEPAPPETEETTAGAKARSWRCEAKMPTR